MGATRRFLRADVRAAVARALAAALPEGGRIAVALSGGRDSIALLDATVSVAASTRCKVRAVHVHHGLSPNADAWERFCADACGAQGVEIDVRRVVVSRGSRIGVEAAARAARYDALAAAAQEGEALAVLLAHHADDQAETALLQLLRGAGPRGIAAMPQVNREHQRWWLRPLLDLPRAAIDAYVGERGLKFIEDESNASDLHLRNALRRSVIPALRALAPGYPGTLVRAAALQAEAALLLDDLARHDASETFDGRTLACATLRALEPRRARNLLRWFLRGQGLPAPSSRRLAAMLKQLADASPDARVRLAHADAEIGVHHDRVVVHDPPPATFVLQWAGEPCVELPHGTLAFATTRGTGIAMRHLESSQVSVRAGARGERMVTVRGAGRRAVADLLREAGVPQWDRLSLPRVYCDDSLAALPLLGVDAAFAAGREERGVTLEWRPRKRITNRSQTVDNGGRSQA